MQEGKEGKNKRRRAAAVCIAGAAVTAVLCVAVCLLKMNDSGSRTGGASEADTGTGKKMTLSDLASGLFRQDEAESPDGYMDANGEYEGNEYHNDLFGITAVFDDGWYFYDSQTREGITANAYGMYGKNDEGAAVYDLYCKENEKGYSISIVIENCEALYGRRLTETEYIEKALRALKSEDMESSGFMIASAEKKDGASTIGSHPVIEVTGSAGGVNICQRITAIQKGSLMMVITATAPDMDGADAAMKVFRQ